MRGSEGNLGRVLGQVAEQLRGQSFNNFGEFREAFWKAVGNDAQLSSQFSTANVSRMQQGFAPYAIQSQWTGTVAPSQMVYNIHHIRPVHQGGGLYDLDNIVIVTPRYHSEVLAPSYHYGH